jgi:hypothetical protein
VSARNQVIVAHRGDGLYVARPPANGLVPLRHRMLVALEMSFEFRVVDADDADGWRVVPVKHIYTLLAPDEQELIAFHWHPEVPGRPDPHLHLGRASQAVGLLRESHIPASNISLEEVLGYAIRELRVEPVRDDWAAILAAAGA